MPNLNKIYYTTVGFVIFISFLLFFLSHGFGGVHFFTVKSESMEPLLKRGYLIQTTQKETYEINEVITYFRDTKENPFVTHRIIDINKSTTEDGKTEIKYQTKGDNNVLADTDLVSHKNVIGTLSAKTPYAGYFIDFAKSTVGYYLLIVIPGILIIINEGLKIKKNWR